MDDPARRSIDDEQLHLFEDFTLDRARGFLTRAGESVHLRPQAYEVLRYLVERSGRLVRKDELIEAVWQGRAVTDDALVQCLMEVRNALGESGKRYVRTVRGRGYIFDTTLASRVEPQLHPLSPVPDSAAPAPQLVAARRPGRPTVRVAVLVVTVLAAALVVGWTTGFLRRSAPASAGLGIRSLAVLPFVPLVPENRDEVLEMGMADTLITKLSAVNGIVVRPISAVRQYTDPATDSVKAGNELRVDAVLSGSIQRAGTRLRVTARLIRVSDGSQLWASHFDEEVGDILALQDSLSERLTRELALELTDGERERLTKRYTNDITAYQNYLRGRLSALRLTREDLFAALDFYRNAIEQDNSYALAYAGLADVYTNLVPRGYIEPAEGRRKAQEAASKAVSLDVRLPEAYAALGQIAVYSAPYGFAAGDRALRHAIQLSPKLAIAHHFLALSLLEQGRFDESLDEWLKARELDPLSPRIARSLAYTYLLKGDSRTALEGLRQARDLGPAFVIHPEIEIYIEGQALDEAHRALAEARRDRGTDPLILCSIGRIYAAEGRRSEALQIIEQLERLSGATSSLAHLIAPIQTALGDEDLALTTLERGLSAGTIPVFYKDAPVWAGLRGHPRFVELLQRMGHRSSS